MASMWSDRDRFMQVVLPFSANKTYFRAKSLPVKTAGRQYSGKPLPLFTMRTENEAWSDPFIVLFDPYFPEQGNSVKNIQKVEGMCDENNTTLRIQHSDGSEQILFQGKDTETLIQNGEFGFSGHFGVVSLNSEGNLERLYFGEGRLISFRGTSIAAEEEITSAELQLLDDRRYAITGNKKVTLSLGLR